MCGSLTPNRLKTWHPAADHSDPRLIDHCGGSSFINRAHPSASPESYWLGRGESGSQAEMSPGVVRGGGAGGEQPEALACTLLTRAKVSQYLRMSQIRGKSDDGCPL